ncbi:MAG: Regulatory protein AtoC [bacterium]|nr:Regulatory protein AtoC [bacterium]
MAKILVVDDEPNVSRSLALNLTVAGYQVQEAQSGEEAIRLAEKEIYDLVLCDLRLAKMNGIEVLHRIKQGSPDTEVLLMTAFAAVETAVQAMKAGAYDYIAKPFQHDELLLTVRKALEHNHLRLRVRLLEQRMRETYGIENMVAASASMQAVLRTVAALAGTDATVLITGESGTGKELVANAIHQLSAWRDQPFIAVNCGALPEQLLESELFGHVRGAFTGAMTNKRGLAEAANGGSLFLDEVGDAPLSIQVKLLRFIETGEIRRVGDTQLQYVKVRVITATNRDLQQMIRAGTFREDLYYRLNVIPLHIPPLRERRDDILLLAQHFLKKHAQRLKRRHLQLAPEAQSCLLQYNWPGNVRELSHAIEHAVTLSSHEILQPGDFPPQICQSVSFLEMFRKEKREDHPGSLAEVEKAYIFKVLQDTQWNQKQAGRILRLSKATLYRRLKEYGWHQRVKDT